MKRIATLIALVAVVTTGCSSLEGTGDKGYISQDSNLVQVAPADRKAPIDLTADDLDGNEISLADHRGRVVVVNVWGSWCNPCIEEQPDLNEAVEETSDIADYIGLNIRDNSVEDAQSFVRSFEVAYPSVYDPDSKELLNFSAVMPVRSPPTTFVLDKEGRIAAAIFGSLPSVLTLVDVVEEVDGETSG